MDYRISALPFLFIQVSDVNQNQQQDKRNQDDEWAVKGQKAWSLFCLTESFIIVRISNRRSAEWRSAKGLQYAGTQYLY